MNDKEKDYSPLKLENQLCFPLYACSREVIKLYKPLLDPLNLTYTQYIVMMVLWEEKKASVKYLGEKLFLDSGTLTPLLKKMEAQGIITRERSAEDERSVIITITQAGEDLRDQALKIPEQMGGCIPLTREEALSFFQTLYKLLNHFKENE